MVADDPGVDAPVARAIPALETVGVGVLAHDPETGEVYAAHRDRRPRPPASTAKLVTAALALDRLGPARRFETRAIWPRSGDRPNDRSSDRPNDRPGDTAGGCPVGDADGRLDRLVLRGDWLSDLSVAALRELSGAVEAAGVVGVGELVVDVSSRDRRRYAPAWTWEDERRAYGAKSTPLALAGNTVDVAVRADGDVTVSVEPDSAAVDLAVDVDVGPTEPSTGVEEEAPSTGVEEPSPTEAEEDLSTDAGKGEPSVGIYREHGTSTIRVDGRLEPGEEYHGAAPVGDPLAHLGHVLRRELEAAGVAVDGDVRVATGSPADARDPMGADPDGERADRERTEWTDEETDGWLCRSAPVGELVRTMNVASDNFVAEQLARAIARRERGRGSWAAWRSVAAEALAALDAGPADLRDGSGLSGTAASRRAGWCASSTGRWRGRGARRSWARCPSRARRGPSPTGSATSARRSAPRPAPSPGRGRSRA